MMNSAKTPLPQRIRDASATKKAILAAAEKEFSLNGLAGARTELIAVETGVTKAMIHHYFKTKDGLYEESMKRTINNMVQAITSMNLDSLPVEEAIKKIVIEIVDSDKSPFYVGVMAQESLQNQGKYFRLHGGLRIHWELINIIKRGIAQGSFRPVAPEIVAISILGATGYLHTARHNLEQLFPDQDLNRIELQREFALASLEIVLKGIRLD